MAQWEGDDTGGNTILRFFTRDAAGCLHLSVAHRAVKRQPDYTVKVKILSGSRLKEIVGRIRLIGVFDQRCAIQSANMIQPLQASLQTCPCASFGGARAVNDHCFREKCAEKRLLCPRYRQPK